MNLPISKNYSLTVNGEPHEVYHTKVGDFAIACFTGDANFVVTAQNKFDNVVVRPLRSNHNANISGNKISINLSHTDRVSIEPYGLDNPLFIFCSEYIEKPKHATHVFKRGTYTEIDIQELKSDDCVYIEEGAVVVGGFVANKANNIEITGNGVVWGLPMQEKGKKYRTILPIECENVKISGISVIDAPSWNVVPTGCKNVTIYGVNIIGMLISTDGFNVVGCENVTVKHCFAYVNDDCVAIKACHYNGYQGARNVKNVTISDCVFWKQKCGNALEIGYETSAEEICDILFENIDIIHSEYEGWQSGSVFSIHNGDRATVHHITFKDIYIEDAQEKLIDIKILSSKYSSDYHRGHVNNITFDGIYVTGDILPPSIIRGYEPDLYGCEPHIIDNIKVNNLFLNDKKVTGQMNAHAVVELASNVEFC